MKKFTELRDIINNQIKGTRDNFVVLNTNNTISLHIGILDYDNTDVLCIMPCNLDDCSELDYYYFTELSGQDISSEESLNIIYNKYTEFYNKYIMMLQTT